MTPSDFESANQRDLRALSTMLEESRRDRWILHAKEDGVDLTAPLPKPRNWAKDLLITCLWFLLIFSAICLMHWASD